MRLFFPISLNLSATYEPFWMTEERPFYLDKKLIQESFNQSAAHYDEVAVLQREVGNRLLERLELVRLTPQTILDVGCGTGFTTTPLLKKYRKAQVIGLDIAFNMLMITRRRVPWFRTLHCVCGDAEALPLADDSCDLLLSNLTLQWCGDLDRVFQEFRRVLKPGGLLLASSFGPDTLFELRGAFARADALPHVSPFASIAQFGDALVHAGFLNPVLDRDEYVTGYADLPALMRELRAIGATNALRSRRHTLTGKARFAAAAAAYEAERRSDGMLPATWEVTTAMAWAPEHGAPIREGGFDVTAVPLSHIPIRRRR
jgi:malonyl-CoA O-methyltransferase